MRGGRIGGRGGLQRGESMLRENVAIICIERSGTLPLTRCVSRVRVNSPAPLPAAQQTTTSHLRRSQSAVVGLSRESEERERAMLKREEKNKEGDPLEEVREGIVRMMEEKREKQHLAKVLSELREAHKELEEEVKVLREENKRLKEAVLVVDG